MSNLPQSWDEEESPQPEAQVPAVQTKQPTATQLVQQSLRKMESQFTKLLPSSISFEKFEQITITAIRSNPDLLRMDKDSLFKACLDAAEDGLLPNGKEAAFVPYKGKVKYTPMVWGIVKKVRQSGELLSLTCEIVYEKDRFRYWVDASGPKLEHEPDIFAVDRGQIKGGYALALTKDGAAYIEVMSEKEIQDVKKSSPGADRGPWAGAFANEMRRKTVIRRLSKRLPASTDLERVFQRDDDLYDFGPRQPGLADEINGRPLEGLEHKEGDKIESLRDLRESANGPLPREDVQGEPAGRAVEHGSDVQGSPRGAAPNRVEAVPGQAPGRLPRSRRAGMGDRPQAPRRHGDQSPGVEE